MTQEVVFTVLGAVVMMGAQTVGIVMAVRQVIREATADAVKAHDENIHAHTKLFGLRNGREGMKLEG